MILPDHEIRELAISTTMIVPFESRLLNSASYDVCLSSEFITEEGNKFKIIDTLILSPGDFFLGGTTTIFNLPDNIGAFFALKSSLARQGLTHNMAGWCDPGWHNSSLTMELGNATKYTKIVLKPNQRIGQMIFMRLTASCEQPYVGKYNNDLKVSSSKPEVIINDVK